MPVLQRSTLSQKEVENWIRREKSILFNERLETLLTRFARLHEEIGKHRDESPEERSYATDLAFIQAEAIQQIILDRYNRSA